MAKATLPFHEMAGCYPPAGEHRVLVHPGEAPIHAARPKPEDPGSPYLHTEEPG